MILYSLFHHSNTPLLHCLLPLRYRGLPTSNNVRFIEDQFPAKLATEKEKINASLKQNASDGEIPNMPDLKSG